MATYDVRLQSREEIAEGTMAFHFEKPRDFAFKPGQAVDLVLPASSGVEGESARHAFSIVSAPFEDRLTIATRMRDSVFKRALKSLPVGAALGLEGPFGSLTLHKNRARPAVFIAGGIGITPFISILRQAAYDRLPQRMVLLYSNRRPEDAAFLADLQAMGQQLEGFTLVATMTQTETSRRPWMGETGAIGTAMLGRIAGELQEPIYYLAGPPAMVESMHTTLNQVGAEDDDIRSEGFYGY